MTKWLILAMVLTLATMLAQEGGRGDDGHYHNPVTGEVQPDMCATHEGDTHPCQCERATNCAGGGPNSAQDPGAKCQTYCRKSACSCVTPGCS